MSSAGRLGILLPGMGSVASTFIAGVIAARQGLAAPVGALSQLGRVGNQSMTEALNLAALDDIVFGGWDPYTGNMADAARKAEVLQDDILEKVSQELLQIQPMSAVFDEKWTEALTGTDNVKTGSLWEQAQELRTDIQSFKAINNLDRVVCVWTASTEAYILPTEVHQTIESFEEGLRNSDPSISPSQVYAYALVQEGIPVANGSPNLMFNFPAMQDLACQRDVAISGRDFKTGQTLVKTAIAPMFASRMLGVDGWFSTNILGNRDGLVLSREENFKSKEATKGGVLDGILDAEEHPDLYGDIDHMVRINYYPPKGDEKEGWDNINFFGWMGYKMELKINILCKDSILAAPIVLDLALFMDAAAQAGQRGVIDWLGFYFKEPMTRDAADAPVHHLYEQETILHEALTKLAVEV
jgi:myo-inositol-1-phosphate synthase